MRYRISCFGMQAGLKALSSLTARLEGLAAAVSDIRCSDHAIDLSVRLPAEIGRERLESQLDELAADADLQYLIRDMPDKLDGQRWRLTLLADRPLPSKVLHEVLVRIAGQGLRLEDLRQLSTGVAGDERCVIGMCWRGKPFDLDHLRTHLQDLVGHYQIDCNLAPDRLTGRIPRLAIFDMDGTLLRCECIDELAVAAGSGDEVAAITAAAMRGELAFDESFTRRLGTLVGLPLQAVQDLIDRLPVDPGLERLCSVLHRLGCRLVIASGGFTHIAEILAERYGFDAVVANQLEIADDQLTGRHLGEIVDGAVKKRTLIEQAERFGIPLDQCLAVGDGANDLQMIETAGIGVAYHAKPVVAAAAQLAVSRLDLDGIAYLLGLDDEDIDGTGA